MRLAGRLDLMAAKWERRRAAAAGQVARTQAMVQTPMVVYEDDGEDEPRQADADVIMSAAEGSEVEEELVSISDSESEEESD